MTETEIIGTGVDFLRTGIRGMEPTIESLILEASSEIQIMAYVFTASALPILDLLEKQASNGLAITIVVNHLGSQRPVIVSKLNKLSKFQKVKIIDFVDERKRQLHAKVLIVDRMKALVGSANFTWGGMFTNYEVGVKLEGEAAWKLAALVDSLVYKT
jgi:phosphatidylserine/phosphatidylglycerophosphate/cardiolipin synthase-like enzyme